MPIRSPSIAEPGYQGTTVENTLQDCVVCGVLAINAEGQIIAHTQESDRALLLPSSVKQVLSLQKLPPPVQAIIREVKASGQAVTDRRILLHSESQGDTPLSVSVLPFVPATDDIRMVVILKDVSSSAKTERNLHQLDRLASVGTLSASIAHEVKNALVAVKTFIEMQRDKGHDTELASIAGRELGRVDSIVSHMLKFAAPAPPSLANIHLHEVLDHSLRLVQHRVGNKFISFHRDFKAGTDLCNGDDHQLEQAFVNLLFNAVDAIGPEGILTISTELVADETESQLHEGNGAAKLLRVRITDTGTGIAPEIMEHIFEPFFTTKPSGTGLGLAVTRRIITEHGGSIHVESKPGKGTTFALLLPSGSGLPPA